MLEKLFLDIRLVGNEAVDKWKLMWMVYENKGVQIKVSLKSSRP